MALTCREVWPGDEFGHEGMTVDEEMETIRAILLNPVAGETASCCWGSEGSECYDTLGLLS